MLEFSKNYARKYFISSIRLDVSIHSSPAISLYEKSGFKYVDTVDLGLDIKNLKWFKLYEFVL